MKKSVLLKETLVLCFVAVLVTRSAEAQTHANASFWQAAMVQFTATYTKPDVTFSWKSADEVTLSYYQLEHSTDGNVFTTTGIVPGPERNTSGAGYSYVDRSVTSSSGVIYYRLKIVNTDGKFLYSPIRIVRLGDGAPTVSVNTYPNPVVTDLRIIVPDSWLNRRLTIDLYNRNGKVINAAQISKCSRTEFISMSSLTKGIYFMKVTCGNEKTFQKIIKY